MTKLEQFIHKSILVHGDKYDYSSVIYKNTTTKVFIICPIHGGFLQNPLDHISKKSNCPKCSIENRKQTNLKKYGCSTPLGNTEIQEKIKQTNLEKYRVEYPQQNKKIREKTEQINLDKYGFKNVFQNKEIQEKQKQTNLKKYGVEKPTQIQQVQEKTKQTNLDRYGGHPKQTKKVQDKFKKTCLEKYGVNNPSFIHLVDVLPLINNYDWLYDQYIIQHKTAIQISKEIGIGDTALGKYLRKVEIKIRETHQSYVSKLWMEEIQRKENIIIEYEYQFDPNNKRLKADGYCKETNTIYEFHGDLWHGNPEIYKSTDLCHPKTKKITAGELYQKTLIRENLIKSLGYNLVVMWEKNITKID